MWGEGKSIGAKSFADIQTSAGKKNLQLHFCEVALIAMMMMIKMIPHTSPTIFRILAVLDASAAWAESPAALEFCACEYQNMFKVLCGSTWKNINKMINFAKKTKQNKTRKYFYLKIIAGHLWEHSSREQYIKTERRSVVLRRSCLPCRSRWEQQSPEADNSTKW